MPHIAIEEVERIAKLARLKFTDSEKQKLQKELSDILTYVDQLKEIAGADVSADIDLRAVNRMREDAAIHAEDPDQFLQQAAAREGRFLKVKSVLE